MATVIDSLFRDLDQQEGQRAYNARLLAVLGDGREWEYTGVCVDRERPDGRCSCGHPIRFEYLLRHKVNGRGAVVGSECVNHFQEANPDTFARLTEAVQRTQAELAEKERRARAAEQEARNSPLREEWEACLAVFGDVVRGYRERGRGWLPDALYYAKVEWEAPQYQRACDFEQWFRGQIASIRRALKEVGAGHRLPAEAEVPDKVKRYKGREFRQGADGCWRSEGLEVRRYVRYRPAAEGGDVYEWSGAFGSWREAQDAWNAVLRGEVTDRRGEARYRAAA